MKDYEPLEFTGRGIKPKVLGEFLPEVFCLAVLP